MEFNDVWNLRLGAIWDPNKVKPMTESTSSEPYSFNGNYLLPERLHEDFNKLVEGHSDFPLYGGFDVNVFNAPMGTPAYTNVQNAYKDHVRNWMKEQDISWLGLRIPSKNRPEEASRMVIFEQDPDKAMPKQDLDDLARSLPSNMFNPSFNSGAQPWTYSPFDATVCESHPDTLFDADCPDCSEGLHHRYYVNYKRQRAAAVWEPDKAKFLIDNTGVRRTIDQELTNEPRGFIVAIIHDDNETRLISDTHEAGTCERCDAAHAKNKKYQEEEEAKARTAAIWDPSKVKPIDQPSNSGNGFSVINVKSSRSPKGFFEELRPCNDDSDCEFHGYEMTRLDNVGDSHGELIVPTALEDDIRNDMSNTHNDMWFSGTHPLRQRFAKNYSGDWIAGRIPEGTHADRFGIVVTDWNDDVEKDIRQILEANHLRDDKGPVLFAHPDMVECDILTEYSHELDIDYAMDQIKRRMEEVGKKTAALWDPNKVDSNYEAVEEVPCSHCYGEGGHPCWDIPCDRPHVPVKCMCNEIFNEKAGICWYCDGKGYWECDGEHDNECDEATHVCSDCNETGVCSVCGPKKGVRNGHACNRCGGDGKVEKLAALWDPSRVKTLPGLGESHKYVNFNTNAGMIIRLPENHADDFFKEFGGKNNKFDFDANAIFGGTDRNYKQRVQNWMKQRDIPWMSLSNQWLLEADPNERMNKEDFDQFTGSYAILSSRLKETGGMDEISFFEEHDNLDGKNCSECRDNTYKKLYEHLDRGETWN